MAQQRWSSRVPESTPARFCVFVSEPKSKICEKTDPDPESLFNFSNSKSLCDHFLSKNMMGRFSVGSMIVPRVWTWVRFSNLKNAGSGFKNFWTGASSSLKKWLWPPLRPSRRLCMAQFMFHCSKSSLRAVNLSLFWQSWIWHFWCRLS